MKFCNNLYTTKAHQSAFVFWRKNETGECKDYAFYPELEIPDSPDSPNGKGLGMSVWVGPTDPELGKFKFSQHTVI